MRLQLEPKIVAFFLILGVLLSSVFIYVQKSFLGADFISQTMVYAEARINKQEQNLQHFTDSAQKIVKSIAQESLIKSFFEKHDQDSTSRVQERLALAMSAQPNLVELNLYNNVGDSKLVVRDWLNEETVVHHDIKGRTVDDLGFYFQESRYLKTGEVWISRISLRKFDGELIKPYVPVLFVVTPIFDQQTFLGALIAEFDMTDALADLVDFPKMDTTLLDESGELIKHPLDGWVWSRNLNHDMYLSGEPIFEETGRSIMNHSLFHSDHLISKRLQTPILGGLIFVAQFDPLLVNKRAEKERIRNLVIISVIMLLMLILALAVSQAYRLKNHSVGFKEASNWQSAVFDNPVFGMAHTGFDGSVLRVNARLFDIFGLTLEEFKGFSLNDFLNEESQLLELDLKAKLRSGELPYFQNQELIVRNDGQKSWVMKTVSLIHNTLGEPSYFLEIFEDISDRVMLLDELREKEALAQVAVLAKTQFLANISHEIRTPLNGAIGLTEMALAANHDGDVERYLLLAQDSSKGLLRLLNDFLDFAKLESGSVELIEEEFNLDELVHGIIDTMHYQALKKGNRVYFEFDSLLPRTFVADPIRLRQVIMNLLDNALKFTDNGQVAIKLYAKNFTKKLCEIECVMSDTGIGIPADKIDHIWERFSQVDESDVRFHQGAGLGLAITKYLIEQMHGQIKVTSRVGVGSEFTFCLTLPYVNSMHNSKNMEYLAQARTAIISDDLLFKKLVSGIYSTWRLPVVEFETLEDFMQSVESFDFVLVHKIENITSIIEYRDWPAQLAIANVILFAGFHERSLISMKLKNSHQQARVRLLSEPFLSSTLLEAVQSFKEPTDFDKLRVSYDEVAHMNELTKEEARKQKVLEQMNDAQIKTLLLVEDNEINMMVLENQFMEYPFKLLKATDGLEALEILKHNRVDAIFTDLQMPNMDGFQMSAKVRQLIPDLPIIAVSAAVSPEDMELSEKSGINVHLSKPIDRGQIEKTLEKFKLI